MQLTRHRKAEVLSEEEKERMDRTGSKDYECRSVNIGAMRQAYLQQLIGEGRIRAPTRDEDEPLENYFRRVHERDSNELEAARTRAQELVSVADQGGWLKLDTARTGLGNSRDFQDVLMYLSHAICHFGSAHRKTEEGKLQGHGEGRDSKGR